VVGIYKFKRTDSARGQELDLAIMDAYMLETYPAEIEDMMQDYMRSNRGTTDTQDKCKADIFLRFLSTLDGWGPGKPPMKWRLV